MPWRRCRTNRWVQCSTGPGATWNMDGEGEWRATYKKAPFKSRQEARERACQFLSNCPEVIRTLINEAHGDDTYQRLTIYQHPVDKQYWRSTMYVGRILTFGDAQKMELFMNASREGTQQRQMYLAMIRLSISPSTPWIDVHGEPCASATALLNCCLDGATLRGSGPLPPSWVRF